jgi:hypothetical protein
MTRKIAFYLPQFHPVPANDAFWGKGFTEWTNVTRAKPLFRGHTQPFLPSDLGFYDLRLPASRDAQAKLAKHAGIEGFCYWHYWFGHGQQVLESIFQEVLISKTPDFGFCLGWANQSWTGKWHGLDNRVIFEQQYPGVDDLCKHFYAILPALKDPRYILVQGKPLFLIYQPNDVPDTYEMIPIWLELARKEGLNGIYFVGNDASVPRSALATQMQARVESGIYEATYYASLPCSDDSLRTRIKQKLMSIVQSTNLAKQREGPLIFDYRKYVNNYSRREFIPDDCFPAVIPGWDNTPRSGKRGVVFINESPEHFKLLLSAIHEKLKDRDPELQIVYLKSWNEWAEGNVLEPSMKWGTQYLDSLKQLALLEGIDLPC